MRVPCGGSTAVRQASKHQLGAKTGCVAPPLALHRNPANGPPLVCSVPVGPCFEVGGFAALHRRTAWFVMVTDGMATKNVGGTLELQWSMSAGGAVDRRLEAGGAGFMCVHRAQPHPGPYSRQVAATGEGQSAHAHCVVTCGAGMHKLRLASKALGLKRLVGPQWHRQLLRKGAMSCPCGEHAQTVR